MICGRGRSSSTGDGLGRFVMLWDFFFPFSYLLFQLDFNQSLWRSVCFWLGKVGLVWGIAIGLRPHICMVRCLWTRLLLDVF